MIELRSKGLNAKSIAIAAADADWARLFTDVVEKHQNQIDTLAEQIKRLEFGAVLENETAVKIHLEAIRTSGSEESLKAVSRWTHAFYNTYSPILDAMPDALGKVGKSAWAHYSRWWDDTLGLMKPNGMPVQYAAKLTGAAVGALLGVLDGVAEYKKAGGFTAEFWQWAATTAAISAVAIPIVGAGASFAMSSSPLWGTVGVYALVAGGLYLGVRSVAANLVEAFADEPDSYLYIGAKAVLDALQVFEGQVFAVLQELANLLASGAQAGEVKDGVANLEVEEFQVVGENAVGYTYNDKKTWLFGLDDGVIIGGDENNWLLHTGYGKALGQGGDDVLIGITPEYIRAGQRIGAAPPDGVEDTRRVAEQDLRLTLDGGDGDDWVIALGGTGAITIGGAGRDFLFNTSAYGQLFGDSVDGQGNSDGKASATGKMDSDVFWYWPGTFIMDAKPNDVLQFFGLPMLGGTNTVAGIYAGDGSLAMDWLMPFVFYGYSQGGQLLIYNALMANVGPDDMKGRMVVEKYDFGGWKDAKWGPARHCRGQTRRSKTLLDDAKLLRLTPPTAAAAETTAPSALAPCT
jgi:hypothetical protein